MLIKQTGLKGTVVCFDLFKLEDGTPNLETFSASKAMSLPKRIPLVRPCIASALDEVL